MFNLKEELLKVNDNAFDDEILELESTIFNILSKNKIKNLLNFSYFCARDTFCSREKYDFDTKRFELLFIGLPSRSIFPIRTSEELIEMIFIPG